MRASPSSTTTRPTAGFHASLLLPRLPVFNLTVSRAVRSRLSLTARQRLLQPCPAPRIPANPSSLGRPTGLRLHADFRARTGNSVPYQHSFKGINNMAKRTTGLLLAWHAVLCCAFSPQLPTLSRLSSPWHGAVQPLRRWIFLFHLARQLNRVVVSGQRCPRKHVGAMKRMTMWELRIVRWGV